MKQTKVTRKFLLDLADRIYDPKTRKFLRLCRGTLQNGPDPKDDKRTMHCGLGELYYAMTGQQPEDTGVVEDDVIELAVERSVLKNARDKVIANVAKLGLAEGVEEAVITTLHDMEGSLTEDEVTFRLTLDDIQGVNDRIQRNANGCPIANCSHEEYRKRSMNVAKQLRLAAKLLPR